MIPEDSFLRLLLCHNLLPVGNMKGQQTKRQTSYYWLECWSDNAD